MRPAGGMNELMRQAARLQRKMDKVREDLKDHEIVGSAAGGKVQVTVTCEGKIRSIQIDPGFFESEGLELSLDTVVAAANNALEAADQHVEAELAKVTGGIKVPGLG